MNKKLSLVYHVTTEANYKKIKTQGLIPKKGRLAKKLGEPEKAIYTFLSLEEANNALSNWMGEEFEELEEELGYEINKAH
jgi:hypothetical protein